MWRPDFNRKLIIYLLYVCGSGYSGPKRSRFRRHLHLMSFRRLFSLHTNNSTHHKTEHPLFFRLCTGLQCTARARTLTKLIFISFFLLLNLFGRPHQCHGISFDFNAKIQSKRNLLGETHRIHSRQRRFTCRNLQIYFSFFFFHAIEREKLEMKAKNTTLTFQFSSPSLGNLYRRVLCACIGFAVSTALVDVPLHTPFCTRSRLVWNQLDITRCNGIECDICTLYYCVLPMYTDAAYVVHSVLRYSAEWDRSSQYRYIRIVNMCSVFTLFVYSLLDSGTVRVEWHDVRCLRENGVCNQEIKMKTNFKSKTNHE